jgi:SAM-dependent methyltransferase
MMLVVEAASREPIGLLVLAETAEPGTGLDRRIGYLFAESAWGRGLATELVWGLIAWAGTQPGIRTLTGGVDPQNRASARVLEKCGFAVIDEPDADSLRYRREISPGNEWDRYAACWDTDSAARAYAAAAFASLQRVLSGAGAALDGAMVIDFGCGTGLLTERLVAAGSTVHAVDTSAAMLDILDAKITRHRWDRVRTDTSLPAEREAFDLVVCSSVCSFLDDYPATVDELVARLRDGGLFVQWDWERDEEEAHGLTRAEIRDALTAAGLRDVTVQDAFSVTVDNRTLSPIMGHGRRSLDTARA